MIRSIKKKRFVIPVVTSDEGVPRRELIAKHSSSRAVRGWIISDMHDEES